MPRKTNVNRQPNWKPEQMETDDPGRADNRRRAEIKGGLRGGGGPTWNKGQMEFDRQKKVAPSDMKESEAGPWGTADQVERARREGKRDR